MYKYRIIIQDLADDNYLKFKSMDFPNPIHNGDVFHINEFRLGPVQDVDHHFDEGETLLYVGMNDGDGRLLVKA